MPLLAAWLCLALAVGMTGVFESATAPIIGLTVWGLTALVLLALWKMPLLRKWAITVDLRYVISLHLTRFIGFYFFLLCRQGQLPFAFAAPAGWGDIIVATAAVVLLALFRSRNWKRILLVWNTIGLIDIICVVFLALRLGIQDWASMHALRELPLSLLPMFLVPLILSSHVLIFVRAAKETSRATTAGPHRSIQ